MKTSKKFYLLSLIIFVVWNVSAQTMYQYGGLRRYIGAKAITTLDSAVYRITYSLKYIPDSLNPQETVNDRKILLVGDSITHFYSYYIRLADSALTADSDHGKNSAPIKMPKGVAGEGYDIYSDRHRKEHIVIEPITNAATYQYTEPIDALQWNITSDTCTILSYSCQKATVRFRGREWSAWFTSAVPLQVGLWKLDGLPGLILKAVDSKGQYSFECLGIEQLKSKKQPIIMRTGKIINCTRAEYRKAQKQFYNDYVNALLSMGYYVNIVDNNGKTVERIEPTYNPITNGARMISIEINDKYRKIPYNPIELE
jgi:GLPGLI family protein